MASNDQLVFDLVLETRQAVNDVKSMLAKTNSEAGKEGTRAGNAFGANLKTAILGVASGISFGFLTKQIAGLFSTFQSFSNSNLQLKGAVDAVNSSELERNRILNDSTASIEQKAMAIGLDTSEIYENTKATKSNEGAIKALEKQITAKERALEDETKALEDNVKAIENKRDLEIRSLRDQKGFNTLTKEEQGLEKEITQLELQRLEAIKAGDGNQIDNLNNIIAQKKLDQDIAQKKLDLIDQETEKIEDLYKVQIQELRAEFDPKKNVLQIDVEKAKRDLEDLKATSVSIGGGSVLKKSVLDQIEQAKNEIPKVLKASDFTDLRETLFKKYEGIVPRDAITSAIADLVKGGLKETDQIEATVSRFIDIAAAGKSPFILMGSAVAQLGEQFRSERAALGETAGLTEEYISQILPRGLALLQSEGKLKDKKIEDLNAEERALAKQVGLLDMTADRQNAFNQKNEEGLLAVEKLRAEFENIKLTLAMELGPVLLDVADKLLPLVQQFATFVSENPQLILAIVGIATALTGVLTVATIIAPIIGTVISLVSSLGAIFGVAGAGAGGLAGAGATLSAIFTALTGPIGLVIGAVALVVAGFVLAYNKIDWFKQFVDKALQDISNWFNWAKDNWLQALGQVLGFFVSLPFKMLFWVGDAVVKVIDYISKINWWDVFIGLGKAFLSVLEWAWNLGKDIFSEDNFKKLLKGFIEFLKGFIKGIGSGIPGADKFTDPIINSLPSFAKGGDFVVPPGYPNDSFLMRVQSGERVVVQTPQQQNDNRQMNSNNQVQINNYGNSYNMNMPFNPIPV